METIAKIRLSLIDNYTRIIKSLASRGRNNYQQYLVQPLSSWSDQTPVEKLEQLLSMIKKAELNNSKRIALLYKMALIKSVAPDQLNLSLPGNIAVNFLKSMRYNTRVSKADESLELVNILKEPFKVYCDKEFNRMNKKFEEEINAADTVEVEKLMHINEGVEEEILKKEQLSKKAIANMLTLYKSGNVPEVRKQLVSYLLQFSDPAAPGLHLAVDNIFSRVSFSQRGFKKEVMDSIAVIIYHEILKAIKKNELADAVKFIGKYTVLFRGDPKTPNYVEVDSFEKKFFNIIEEKNLWDKL
ncbi:MAG: hypothetical protein GY754_25540 [bacterium]|nr:hypothetical protein [bacterium]